MTKKVKRIDELTEEQRAQMGPWAEKWIQIGLSTEPADWERFEKCAKDCYRYADLDPNVPVVRVPSPIVGGLAAPIAASLITILRGQKTAAREDGRNESDRLSATKQVCSRAMDRAISNDIDEEVTRHIHRAVFEAVADHVQTPVAQAVDEAIDSAKLVWWHSRFGGSLWSSWSAWESFFREVCHLELPNGLSDRAPAYAGTCESACWWWPNRDFIMVSDRPRKIHLDDHGRLHNTEGLSIEWPDGWGIYSIDGVTLTKDQAVGEVTKEMIESEENAEIRRILVTRYGMERYFTETGAELIDFDGQRALFRDPRIGQWMICTDGSTSDVYQLRVSDDAKTCAEASMSLSGAPDDLCLLEC